MLAGAGPRAHEGASAPTLPLVATPLTEGVSRNLTPLHQLVCPKPSSGDPSASESQDSAVSNAEASSDGATRCTVSMPQLLQAEDADLQGVLVNNEHSGFQGSGYVDGFDQIGDSVTFDFCVATTDYYTFSFRYANGSDKAAWRTIALDDQVVPSAKRFRTRWSWNDWDPTTSESDFTLSTLVKAGAHRLSIRYERNDRGEMALDAVTVRPEAGPFSTSITAMLMNDWNQLSAGVFASRVHPADRSEKPPRMCELRWRGNWQANTINQATGFLRDNTANIAYTHFKRSPLNTQIMDASLGFSSAIIRMLGSTARSLSRLSAKNPHPPPDPGARTVSAAGSRIGRTASKRKASMWYSFARNNALCRKKWRATGLRRATESNSRLLKPPNLLVRCLCKLHCVVYPASECPGKSNTLYGIRRMHNRIPGALLPVESWRPFPESSRIVIQLSPTVELARDMTKRTRARLIVASA